MLIGKSGTFILRAPFTQYSAAGLAGKIVSVSYIQHLVSKGTNVKTNVYTPVTGEALYSADYNNNVLIVTIKTNSGKKYEIPSSYIENLFDDNVSVIDAYITVKVSNLPLSYDFTYVKQQLATEVTKITGVTINSDDIFVSGQDSNTVYSKTEYDYLNTLRENAISNLTTDYGNLVKVTAENTTLKEKLGSLQNYIVSKL